MKLVSLASLLLFSLLTLTRAEESHVVKPASPTNGVFMMSNPYSSTVLELKDGHFRYWFESDAKVLPEPTYPLSGEYTIAGDLITLNNKEIYDKRWKFLLLDGRVTLWRLSSIDEFKTHPTIDPYGVLQLINLNASEAWLHRHDPR